MKWYDIKINMPKVSIIIPVYNLEDCIESTSEYLLNQTEKDIQIIFVDDGSVDSTRTILRRIASKDSRCLVLEQENQGPGAARNLGLSKATGEYVLFLDGDDIFDSELVSKLYKNAVQTEAEIVICGSYVYNCASELTSINKISLRYDLLPNGKTEFAPEEVSDDIFQITGAAPWNKLVKKSFFDKCNLLFPHWYYAEDMAVIFPLLVRANVISIVPEELITYRINRGLSLRDTMDARWKDECNSLLSIRSDLLGMNKYDLFFNSFMKRVVYDLERLFRNYQSQEAFSGLFHFAKEQFDGDLKKYSAEITDSYIIKMIDLICEETSPLDFCLKFQNLKKESDLDKDRERRYKYWKFPYEIIPKDSRLVLYGAGDVGFDLYIQIIQTGWCYLTAWVDSFPERYVHKGLPVVGKESVKEKEFDFILIAIRDSKLFNDLKNELISLGIDPKKIIGYSPENVKIDLITIENQ